MRVVRGPDQKHLPGKIRSNCVKRLIGGVLIIRRARGQLDRDGRANVRC